MPERRLFGCGPVTERSMPFWCVGNPLGDPFGEAVLPSISALENCRIICEAAKDGLIERTGFHDDDLVPWDPEKPRDDLDAESPVHATLMEIKRMLSETGVQVNTATCNLHGNKIFRRGGLTNPDPQVRALAIQKVERTIRIGHLLGAEYLTYWVARDGFEVAVTTPWKDVYSYIADGLNSALEYIRRNGYSFKGGTIEPKPNEPRGHMFLPTAGHAVGFIMTKLNTPSFWGVNPELRQHEGMTLLDPLTTLAFLVSTQKLSFLHFGNQINGQFDNDFPPLVGPEGLKETALMFWLLDQLGWKGVVEYDCHMLRTEGDPKDPIGCRKKFIENCSLGLAIALQIAGRLGRETVYTGSETEADLKAMSNMFCLSLDAVRKMARKG